MKNKKEFLKACLLVSLLGTGVGMANPLPDNVSNEQCVIPGVALLPGENNKQESLVQAMNRFRDRSMILLGEHHDNEEHHRWQLQMISGLYGQNPNIALGFEMFPRSVQPVLDRWLEGELDEETFLKQVKWGEYWSFDAKLYMPMFHFARMNHIPMHALENFFLLLLIVYLHFYLLELLF